MNLRLIGFFILLSTHLYSQNLVPNGGFEDYDNLPSNIAQWYNCKYWSNIDDPNNTSSIHGSPDYFHELVGGPVGLPNSTFGFIHPKFGKAIMGLLVISDTNFFSGSSAEFFREYISCELTSNLVIGEYYEVSLWVSNGESPFECGNKSDGLGLCLSVDALIQNEAKIVEVSPQFQADSDLWSSEWQQLKFNFIADSAYKYLTIGNFKKNENTSCIYVSEANAPCAYYFIDEVVVEHIPVSNDTICYGESIQFIAPQSDNYSWRIKGDLENVISTDSILEITPLESIVLIFEGDSTFLEKRVIVNGCPELLMPNVFTPNNDQINDFFTFIKKKNVKDITLVVVNRWGNMVYQTNELSDGWDGKSNGDLCSDGVYFWSIYCTDVFDNPLLLQGTVSLFGSE